MDSVELQQAVYTRLRADAALTALLASSAISGDAGSAVYDRAPQSDDPADGGAFPYVVLGDDTAVPFDTDDRNGHETTLTLHTFSRYRGKKEVKQIHAALYDSLHDAALAVSGRWLISCAFEYAEIIPDPDGLTQHGVMRFRIVTQAT